MIAEESLITVHGMPRTPTPALFPILLGAGVLGALGLAGYTMGKTAEAVRETKGMIMNAIFPLVPAGIGIYLLASRKEDWAKIVGIGLVGVSAMMLFSYGIKGMIEQPGKTCAMAGQEPEKFGGVCCQGLKPKRKYLFFGPYVCG